MSHIGKVSWTGHWFRLMMPIAIIVIGIVIQKAAKIENVSNLFIIYSTCIKYEFYKRYLLLKEDIFKSNESHGSKNLMNLKNHKKAVRTCHL